MPLVKANSRTLRLALHLKATVMRGTKSLNTRIQQDREFHKQFTLEPGVVLYPKKKKKTDPDTCALGLIGYLGTTEVHILPDGSLPDYFFEYHYDGVPQPQREFPYEVAVNNGYKGTEEEWEKVFRACCE